MTWASGLLPALWGDAVEIDELVVRCRRKRCYRYLWVAVSRVTRQVLGFVIGDRSEKSLWQLWFSLPSDYRRKLVYPPKGHPTSMRCMQLSSVPGSTALVLKAVARPA